jgi:Domain of unknown function (DUF4440)
VTALLMVAFAISPAADSPTITQDELVCRTQELFDAVAIGNKAPWKRYFAEDTVYFDEKGRSMDKSALVADITPLPKGYSGRIKLVKPQSRILGHTAILTYDLDETETIHGQNMKARYHGTDTWLFRDDRWQIVAGQIFRYYEDPAPGKVDMMLLNDYVGTYELAPGITLVVLRQGDKLYLKRGERPQELLVPETCDLFYLPGVEGRRLFRRNYSGKVDALIDRRNNEDLVWKKL